MGSDNYRPLQTIRKEKQSQSDHYVSLSEALYDLLIEMQSESEKKS